MIFRLRTPARFRLFANPIIIAGEVFSAAAFHSFAELFKLTFTTIFGCLRYSWKNSRPGHSRRGGSRKLHDSGVEHVYDSGGVKFPPIEWFAKRVCRCYRRIVDSCHHFVVVAVSFPSAKHPEQLRGLDSLREKASSRSLGRCTYKFPAGKRSSPSHLSTFWNELKSLQYEFLPQVPGTDNCRPSSASSSKAVHIESNRIQHKMSRS